MTHQTTSTSRGHRTPVSFCSLPVLVRLLIYEAAVVKRDALRFGSFEFGAARTSLPYTCHMVRRECDAVFLYKNTFVLDLWPMNQLAAHTIQRRLESFDKDYNLYIRHIRLQRILPWTSRTETGFLRRLQIPFGIDIKTHRFGHTVRMFVSQNGFELTRDKVILFMTPGQLQDRFVKLSRDEHYVANTILQQMVPALPRYLEAVAEYLVHAQFMNSYLIRIMGQDRTPTKGVMSAEDMLHMLALGSNLSVLNPSIETANISENVFEIRRRYTLVILSHRRLRKKKVEVPPLNPNGDFALIRRANFDELHNHQLDFEAYGGCPIGGRCSACFEWEWGVK